MSSSRSSLSTRTSTSALQSPGKSLKRHAWTLKDGSLSQSGTPWKPLTWAPPTFPPSSSPVASPGSQWFSRPSNPVLVTGECSVNWIFRPLSSLYRKTAHNVNADEAAVLGAAFYGASLSPQFKTKEIKVEDRLLGGEDFQVSYTAESKSGGHRTINTLIFPSGSKYGSKKVLNFRRKENFGLVLSYKFPSSADTLSPILNTELLGVSDAIANLTSKGATDPHVRVQVELTENGIVAIQDAYAYGEVKEESIAGKIKNMFGGSSSSTDTATDTETATESAEASEPTQVKMTPHTIPLDINTKYMGVVPYTPEEVTASRKRIIAVDQAERLRAKTEEARNMLEGYLYRLRDLLDGEETSPFMLYSKPEERKKLEDKFGENMNWFHEDGEEADMAELWRRRDEME